MWGREPFLRLGGNVIRVRLSKRQAALLHYFLSGLGVAVAASLTGVASSGVLTLATLTHAIGIAVIVAVADTIRFLTGAPGTTPAAPTS